MREKGLESLTDPVSYLVKAGIEPIRRGLVDWITQARKSPTCHATALPYIEACDPDVTALIALRKVLDSASKPRRVQSVAVQIGGALEDELRMEAFERENSPLYDRIQKHVKESPLGYRPDYRRNVLIHAANKFGVTWKPWPGDVKFHVGGAILGVVVKTTGYVEMVNSKSRNVRNESLLLVPTAKLVEWIRSQGQKAELLHPPRLPMVAPPTPFSNNTDGGYRTPILRKRLVPMADELMQAAVALDKMPAVYRAINALQAVPWRVNTAVLEVVEALINARQDIPGAAMTEDIPLPLKPDAAADMRLYKLKSREIFYANLANRGRMLAASQTVSIARRMSGRPIWFPYMLDFRGRVYCVPQYLTPQGSDLSKGLLEFNDGAPADSPEAVKWLRIHVANSFGLDKVPFDEREQWVEQNRRDILRAADDPLGFRWWSEADSPIQFLAACREYAAWSRDRDTPLHGVVSVDGSCNGIQHLSALSLDEEAGALVNLVPGTKPSDIYGRVAERAVELLQKSDNPYARQWLDYGVGRSLCKRPTMILPYGGTMMAVETYIDEYVTEQLKSGKDHPFGTKRSQACRFLAKVVWDAMGHVVKGPRLVMQWTKAVASAVSKTGNAISWTTPAGFRVRQAYPLMSPRRVKTRMGDAVYSLTLSEPTDALDTRKQATALAPNWIHSLDAAALHLTIGRLLDADVTSIMAVHDSYGCHAANMERMSRLLRTEFAAMYSGEDLQQRFLGDISRFAGGIELPQPPPKGQLDITQVVSSPYFFA